MFIVWKFFYFCCRFEVASLFRRELCIFFFGVDRDVCQFLGFGFVIAGRVSIRLGALLLRGSGYLAGCCYGSNIYLLGLIGFLFM